VEGGCASLQPRTETDSFGPIEVPGDALWGAQTARSLRFFAIGEQRMGGHASHVDAGMRRVYQLLARVPSIDPLSYVVSACRRTGPLLCWP